MVLGIKDREISGNTLSVISYLCVVIALVDDDKDDLELLQEMLTKSSYQGQSRQFYNGQELLDFLRSADDQPGVITLDINMPVKNGFETLAEIKSDPTLKEIPVIMLSASSSRMDESKCRELGCDLYIRKPSSIQAYDEIIRAMLGFVDSK